MLERMRPNAKWLLLTGAALAISVGLASGVEKHPTTNNLPALKQPPAPVFTSIARESKSAGEVSDAFTSISALITPAVVRIQSERFGGSPAGLLTRGLRQFLEGDSSGEDAAEVAGGSGFLISEDGYIVTNNHVVEGADRITVMLYNRRSVEAAVVGRDPSTDVALLKIDGEKLPAIRFGDSDNTRVGEWVLAVGNPGFGSATQLDFTVTSGIISAKGRPLGVLDDETGTEYENFAIEDFLQTDAVINPGNSGGPLVNLKGEVIGVNAAIASSSGYNQGYAFAIPSNLVQRVVKDLIEHGHANRPLLGVSIQDVSQEDAEVYGLSEIAGVLIEDFPEEDSPARVAGLQRGDVIVQLGNQKVERVGQLQRLVAQHDPGRNVAVRVIRYGQPVDVQITLAQAPLPAEEDRGARPRTPPGAGRLGIQIIELTGSVARQLGFERSGGALIANLVENGAAYRKGIRPHARILELNRQTVENARDAQAILRTMESGDIASFVLQEATGRVYIANVRVP